MALGTPLPAPWRIVVQAGSLGLAHGFCIVLGFALAVLAWGLWVPTWDPQVRETTITFDDPALRGRSLNVALVSDIHVGNHGMTAARLDRVVDQIMARRPDAILLAGDFVNGEYPGDPAMRVDLLAAPLSRLHAPLGVFAVLGNHDRITDPAAVQAALTRAGVTVLVDQLAALGPITLIGVDDALPKRARLPILMTQAHATGRPLVVMEHAPSLLRLLAPDVPVILAGHTHCGQVRLPGWTGGRNPITGTTYYNPRFRCGLVRWRNRIVLVSGGVGSGSFPLRIGTRPDFWMIRFTGR
ncbi:metallophosphoesterase [Novosphingobium sp. SG720]|uniref:metallophosphoesterase n=1 Tax=Novosphingobium sp. SG720 TaxID=2586998 RepID=UPI001446BD6F|nr:metallophosphoesterase [Novosphingobium sp. SG720]NKJ41118.1 hypothetical protein [Novosphingobium sp. SG720]